MPVIELSLSRLKARVGKFNESDIVDSLPFLGLDIEKIEGDAVAVEYSPNRPDFCSEVGIARSLLGQLGLELGIPKYKFGKSNVEVSVEGTEIKRARPFIFCLNASLEMNDETIKQLITAQEDLHNGIGGKRSAVAIGLHDGSQVKPPIRYFATGDPNFSFVPLGGNGGMTIQQVLEATDQGRNYGKLLGTGPFPLLVDAQETVLSMPPVINGERTRLKTGSSKLFVDVTATNRRSGEITIAILAAMIADLGGSISSVLIANPHDRTRRWTPDMAPTQMKFDLRKANKVLGLKLKISEARRALERSRLSLLKNSVLIPRFRADILHPIDLVEEVALGYGVASLEPQKVSSYLSGSTLTRSRRDERIAEILVGLGLTEIADLSLRSEYSAEAFGSDSGLRVENPKSASYEFLPDQLMPSLLASLSRCKREEYPQKLFQQSVTFSRSDESETAVDEQIHVCALVAESRSNFTSISSLLNSFGRLATGEEKPVKLEAQTEAPVWFAEGRTARILFQTKGSTLDLGIVGEISPATLSALGIEVPVSGFEINIEPLIV
jgi:phenylalanyl-tRNA synthetase beta chain